MFTLSDDYWTYCEDDAAYNDLYTKWSSRYNSSTSGAGGTSKFCGLSFTQHEDDSVSLGSGKLMTSLDILLTPLGQAPTPLWNRMRCPGYATPPPS